MSQHDQLSMFDDPEPTKFSVESELISEEDKISLLALSEVQGIGFATVRALFKAYNGKLMEVWNADDDNLYAHLHQASIPQAKQVIHQVKARSKEVYEKAKEHYFYLKHRQQERVVCMQTA